MRPVVAALSYLVFAALAPLLLVHRKLRRGQRQRFGYLPRRAPGTPAPVWLHGASAGDVLALLPTARALRAQNPNVPIVASTLTSSGLQMARRHADAFDQVFFCPWDLPHVTARAMRRVQPAVLVLEYTELWPHLVTAARNAGARVVLHNGRFGHAHLGRYRALFRLVGNLLEQLDVALLRDEHEAERAVALGLDPARALVTGNTKFDNVAIAPDPRDVLALRAHSGFGEGVPVWVAGSTHEGEEGALLEAFVALRKQTPPLKLVIAPRYPERAGKVVAACARLGLRARLRQRPAGRARPPDNAPGCDVFVLNSVGELLAAYAMATAVFVGGSFTTRGGQNILEPAACGRPVLFGPHMDNFADSVGVLLGRGGVQVRTPAQLVQVLADWLRHPERCRALGALARAQVHTVRGAAQRNACQLLRLWGEVRGPAGSADG